MGRRYIPIVGDFYRGVSQQASKRTFFSLAQFSKSFRFKLTYLLFRCFLVHSIISLTYAIGQVFGANVSPKYLRRWPDLLGHSSKPMEPNLRHFRYFDIHPIVFLSKLKTKFYHLIVLDFIRFSFVNVAVPIFCHHQSYDRLLTDPNPNSPANSEAASLFRENLREYNRRVTQCVEYDSYFSKCFKWQQMCAVIDYLMVNLIT